jgi:tetratricopeptide (TPR) repeat protein
VTANVLFPIGTIKAERLLYLPSVGWVLACGWLAARTATHRGAGLLVALALLTAVYGGRTWLRNRDWRDNGTLFVATLRDAPDSAKAHFNAGVVLEKSAQFDEALIQYRQALEIYPRYADAARGIGNTDEKKGIDGAALHWYEDALQRDPALVKAHLQIGEIRARRGEYDAAKAAYLTGLATEPDNPVLLANLGSVLLVEGDRWRAGVIFERLEHLDTLDPDEHEFVAQARYEIEVALR